MGTLFLVSTPIGNLEDFSERAKRILEKADFVLAEDTRKSKCLFDSCKTNLPRLVSYFQENEAKRIPEVIAWLEAGKNVCLISNAGTPTISDPGYKLVGRAIEVGMKVTAIPGPTALIAALTVSGFSLARFVFLGFLPKKKKNKKKLLKRLTGLDRKLVSTLVLYESPTRLVDTLKLARELFGNVKIAICRELTKQFEEVIRGRIEDILVELEQRKVKGEITLVLSLETR